MEANVNSLFADSFTLSWPEYKTMSLEQHKGRGFERFLFIFRSMFLGENYTLSSTQVGTLNLVSRTPVTLFEARPFCDEQRELRMKARFINQKPKKSLKIIY